jgi:WD40 repeat protein
MKKNYKYLFIVLLIFYLAVLLPAFSYAEPTSHQTQVPTIFIQSGHSGLVKSLALSPDGKYLVSSDDKTIKLLNVSLKKEVRTILVESAVSSIAFSPDGNYVVTGDANREILVWDFKTWRVVKRLNHSGEGNAITKVVFLPDGRHLLSSEYGDFLYCWDVQEGTLQWKLKVQRPTTAINVGVHIAVSRNGEKVAVGSHFEQTPSKKISFIDIYSIASRKLITRLEEVPDGEIVDIAFSPDEKNIITATAEKVLVVDVRKNKMIKEIPLGAWSVSFSSNGKYFAVGQIGAVYLFDAKNFREMKKLEEYHPVIFSHDSKQMIMSDGHYGIQRYDIARDKTTNLLPVNPFQFGIENAVYDAAGKDIMTVGCFGIFRWNLETASREEVTWQNAQRGNIFKQDFTISDDLRYVARVYVDTVESGVWIELADLKTGKLITRFHPPENFSTNIMRFTPDNRYLIADSPDGGISAVNLNNYSLRTFSGKHEKRRNDFDRVAALSLSPDSRYLFSGSGDGIIQWDIGAGKFIRKLVTDRSVRTLAVSPDGRMLLSDGASGDFSGFLWDIASGRPRRAFYKGGYILCGAFSPDGKFAVTGNVDGLIRVWDIASGKEVITLKGHHGQMRSVRFSPDGGKIVSVSGDGSTRLWDIDKGKEIAQFVSFAQSAGDGYSEVTSAEWIIITPEGSFSASPNAATYLNVRVGGNVYSIDNFYEKFFNPIYVASVLQGKKVETIADIRKGVLAPPEIRILSPVSGQTFNSDRITVTVSATDMGGGIAEIRLYQNGKAMGDDTRAVKIVSHGAHAIKEFNVLLVDGINTFRAVGFSKDRTESNPYELTVKLTAPAKDVSLYVLAVGINKYKNPALNLNYAEPDAEGIAGFFRNRGGRLFKKVDVRKILDEKATKDNILSHLEQLRNVQSQDAVLIYLAGHGENIHDKWYFIPYELTHPEREEDVRTKAISSDELSTHMKNIKAQKILVLIDACKSGAMLVALRGFEDRKALSQLSRSTGVHIVAASTKDQFAAEVKELGHGVFTYTLLEGLSGKAAGKGDSVTVRKLMSYVEEQLPEITKKYKQEAQYPVVDSRGMDFPLVIAQ